MGTVNRSHRPSSTQKDELRRNSFPSSRWCQSGMEDQVIRLFKIPHSFQQLPALAIGAGLIAVDLKCFLDEDSLNEFFGVAWNWGMIATIITLPTAWCLLWVILSATLPAITLPF